MSESTKFIVWEEHLNICEICKKAIRLRFSTSTPRGIARKCCEIGRPIYKEFVLEREHPDYFKYEDPRMSPEQLLSLDKLITKEFPGWRVSRGGLCFSPKQIGVKGVFIHNPTDGGNKVVLVDFDSMQIAPSQSD